MVLTSEQKKTGFLRNLVKSVAPLAGDTRIIMAQSYHTFADEEAGNAPSKASGMARKSVAAGVALVILAVLGVSTTVSRGYSMLDVVRRQREFSYKIRRGDGIRRLPHFLRAGERRLGRYRLRVDGQDARAGLRLPFGSRSWLHGPVHQANFAGVQFTELDVELKVD